MASVKWLSRIIVTENQFGGFFQTLDYAYFERKEGLPTLVPITKIEVKSAIARPVAHEPIEAGKPYRIFGAAWAGESAIAKVEVSTDGGKTWAAAKLLDEPKPLVWTLWEYFWQVSKERGPVKLLARATDADGKTQPMERDIDRRNYLISHVIPIEVVVC